MIKIFWHLEQFNYFHSFHFKIICLLSPPSWTRAEPTEILGYSLKLVTDRNAKTHDRLTEAWPRSWSWPQKRTLDESYHIQSHYWKIHYCFGKEGYTGVRLRFGSQQVFCWGPFCSCDITNNSKWYTLHLSFKSTEYYPSFKSQSPSLHLCVCYKQLESDI